MTTITEPGIFHGMPETTYRNPATIAATLGRALSPSSAKTILTNPERYAWERDHGRAPKTAYDEGSLIHALVLRSHDNRIRVVDATDWRTKQSQAARDDAHTAGFIPVHRGQLRDAARVAGTAVGPADSGPGGLRGRLASAWRDVRWVRPDNPETDAAAGPTPDEEARDDAEPAG